MSGIRPGTCAAPGPYDQHCTELPDHRWSCYDAGEDASFNAGSMRDHLPDHDCNDPACEANERTEP